MMTETTLAYPYIITQRTKIGQYGMYDIRFYFRSGQNIRLVFQILNTEYPDGLSGGVQATSYHISLHKNTWEGIF